MPVGGQFLLTSFMKNEALQCSFYISFPLLSPLGKTKLRWQSVLKLIVKISITDVMTGSYIPLWLAWFLLVSGWSVGLFPQQNGACGTCLAMIVWRYLAETTQPELLWWGQRCLWVRGASDTLTSSRIQVPQRGIKNWSNNIAAEGRKEEVTAFYQWPPRISESPRRWLNHVRAKCIHEIGQFKWFKHCLSGSSMIIST